MSDTRNHTTRDQLADAFRSVAWLEYKDFDPEWAAFEKDALDALEPVIAAVRAAAVAETTAAIEGIPDRLEPYMSEWGTRAIRAEIRAALSGGRTALDTMLAQAWDEGHHEGWRFEHAARNPYRADTGADQ